MIVLMNDMTAIYMLDNKFVNINEEVYIALENKAIMADILKFNIASFMKILPFFLLLISFSPVKGKEITHIAGVLLEYNITLSEVLLREVYGNVSREGDILFSKNVEFAGNYKGVDIKIGFSEGVISGGSITVNHNTTKIDGSKLSDLEWLAELIEGVKLTYGEYSIVDANRSYTWDCENGSVNVVRQNNSDNDFSISVIYEISKKEEKADIVIIREKAKEYFRDIYVEANFKNPYSYELLKIEVTPVVAAISLDQDLKSAKDWVIRTDTASKDSHYQKMKTLLASHEKKLKQDRISEEEVQETRRLVKEFSSIYSTWTKQVEKLSAEISNLDHENSMATREYEILIHCQADNSYGGKVLGRYKFNLHPTGTLKKEVYKVNQFGFPLNEL